MRIRIVLVIASFLSLYTSILQAAERVPNFVIIMADDLGYGDLEKDPSETYSYTREMPEVAARLHGLLVVGQEQLGSTVLTEMWTR